MIKQPEETYFSNDYRLKDSRLTDRLHSIVSCLQISPEKSFPDIFQDRSDLEGFYRFVNNDRVDYQELITSACRATMERTSKSELTLAIHDTSAFDFSHAEHVEGLGRLSSGKKGFYGHFCIASNLDREIIGILGLNVWIRKDEPKSREKKQEKKRSSGTENENSRWLKMIKEVQNQFSGVDSVIHVADREADDYISLCEMKQSGIRFVFRGKYNRKITDKSFGKLFVSLRDASFICEREVKLSPRKAGTRPRDVKDYPPRDRRIAQLGVSAKSVAICRSQHIDNKYPKETELNFVRIFEMDAPAGETPVEWFLITSEPIETEKDLLKIVDIYRARWSIEEYFKALKAGCSFEKRGLESLGALLKCLAVFAPIACTLYNLKTLARVDPNGSTEKIATPTQIKVLAKKTKKTESELGTLSALMYAIASLGGHIKHNGQPGWQVLARGYEKLLQLEQGFLLALDCLNHIPDHRSPAICVE